MTIEYPQGIPIPSPGPARPAAVPGERAFAHVVEVVNALLAYRGGDTLQVSQDLVHMAGVLAEMLANQNGAGVRCVVARAMIEAARRLDSDAASAPRGLQ